MGKQDQDKERHTKAFQTLVRLQRTLVRRLTDEMDSATPVKVIATGGLASAMIEKTTTIQQNEPNLTLDGMRIIHSRLKRK